MPETGSAVQESRYGRSPSSASRKWKESRARAGLVRLLRRAASRLSQKLEPVSQQTPPAETSPVAERPVYSAFTEEMLHYNRVAADGQGVEPAVHRQDFIYWFCCNHPKQTLETAANYYFQDGERSAAKLADLVAALGYEKDRPVKLLEFAAGYGCVSRHLKKNSQLDLVSCDIHPEAIDFLANRIGVKTLMSVHVPEQFSPPEKYDIVFALSFFSHMPKTSFGRWIRALFDALSVPGYLIFTTHGLKSCDCFGITPNDIPADGFLFVSQSEQNDLDTAEYGSALATPDFVTAEIYRQTGAPIVAYKHGEWWTHQDLWVIKREK